MNKGKRKIASLHGILDVERKEVPPMMIMARINGVNGMSAEIEMFARMADLSPGLRAKVKDALVRKGNRALTHDDTIKELAEVKLGK